MQFAKLGLGVVVTANIKQFVASLAHGGRAVRNFFSKIDIGTRIFPSLSRAMESVRPGFKAIEVGARMAGQAIARLTRRVITFVSTAAAGLRRGAGQIASGFRDMAMGMAPLTLAVGAGFRSAAQYERQMSAVGAITRANAEDMTAMALEAQRLGVVTVFSAREIGEGMEFIARAGAKPKEVIAAMAGVANAAAADAITLAQAGDVVARVVKGLGLEWAESSHVADVLALASASANTNILALGESFVYGVAASRQMGVSLEETTALMAKMADAGLKGSLGGTAYTNMMTRLGKTTEKGRKIIKSFGVELEDVRTGKLRPVIDIVMDFDKKLQQIKSTTQRQGMVIEVFGRRGARAYNALAAAGAAATHKLQKELELSSEGIGAAAKMAERRLNNFLGRLVLLRSSLEGLAIGVFSSLLKNLADSTKSFVEVLNKVLFALNKINAAYILGEKVEFTRKEIDKLGVDAIEIAKGIRQGMDDVGEAWDWLTEKVGKFGDKLKEWFGGTEGLRGAARMITKLIIFGSLLTPIILALGILKWAIGGFIKVAIGLGTMLFAAFWPILIVAGLVYFAYLKLRKENETFLDTAVRVWGDIKNWILDVYNNALKPLWEGIRDYIMPILPELREMFWMVVNSVLGIFRTLYEEIFGGNEMTRADWHDTGQTIGQILVTILGVASFAIMGVSYLVQGLIKVFGFLWTIISSGIKFVSQHFAQLGLAFKDILEGNILRGLARIGTAILDFLLIPIRLFLKGVMKVADWLEIDIPEGLRTFVEEGTTGLIFGKEIGIDPGRRVYRTREEMLRGIGAKEGVMGMVSGKAAVKPLVPEGPPGLGIVEEERMKRQLAALGFPSPFEAEAGILGKARLESIDAMKDVKNSVDNMGDRVEKAAKEKPCVEAELKVDGRNMAVAQGKHQQEFKERTGFKSTPWQRRAILEHGATPVTKAG